MSSQPPFREVPTEARIAALRAEREALRTKRLHAVARGRGPWSWPRFAGGLALGLLMFPVAAAGLLGLIRWLLRPAPPPPQAPRHGPASWLAGGSPVRCVVTRCAQDSDAGLGAYECASRSAVWSDAGRSDRISWSMGQCTSGDPCAPGMSCEVDVEEKSCWGTCE